MGAEFWLRFTSREESDRVRKYLNDVSDDIWFAYDCSVWFDFVDEAYTFDDPGENEEGEVVEEVTTGSEVLRIGYCFGPWSSQAADAVGREIAKRFQVYSIGADSVGWYKEPYVEDVEMGYMPHTSWVEWLLAYRIENDRLIQRGIVINPKGLEESIQEWFEQRDVQVYGASRSVS